MEGMDEREVASGLPKELQIDRHQHGSQLMQSMDGKSECKLLGNKPFLFLVLSGSFIMFAIAAIQYWGTNYFIKALGANQKSAFIYFGLVAITAPLLGAVASAFVTDWLGGFASAKTLPVGFLVAVSIFATSLFIVVEDHVITGILLFWVVLFNGALLLPIVIGVMLTKVEPEMRPAANSFANFMYNILGFFPAPLIYGLANELSDDPNRSHNGQGVVSASCLVFAFFILLSMLTDKKMNYFTAFRREEQVHGLSNDEDLFHVSPVQEKQIMQAE